MNCSCNENEKCFKQNLYKKSKHTFYVQELFFFFENCDVYDNLEEKTTQCCVPTTTMATRTRPNDALRVHCQPCPITSTTISDN